MTEHRACTRRRLRPWIVLRTLAISLLTMSLTIGLPLSFGFPGSADASPLGEYATRLSFELAEVDPPVVTAQGPDVVAITGRYTNTGDDPVTDLDYRFQRGKRLSKASAVQAEVDDPAQPVEVINSSFRSLPTDLDPHESSWFSLRVRISGDSDDTLAISEPGVYPVMVNINGTVQGKGGETQARIGELHLLVTVISLPGSPSTGGHEQAASVGMLWPFVDRPHLGVDGVFLDDDLAADVAPGGRLTALGQRLAATRLDPDVVTLVVDPMLLDELDLMSRGYWVAAEPGIPQERLTADAPTEDTEDTESAATTATTATTESAATTTDVPATDVPATTDETDETDETDSGAPETGMTSSTPEPTIATGAPSGTGSAGSAGSAGSTGPIRPTGPTALTGRTGPTGPTEGSSGEESLQQESGNNDAGRITAPGAPGQTSAGSPATATPPSQDAQSPRTSQTSETEQSPETQQTPEPGQPSETSQTPSEQQSPTEQQPLEPQPAHTVAGTGSADAAALLDTLRELARQHRVLVLPYGDPDVVALVRAKMTATLSTAVDQGRAVATRILGAVEQTGIADSAVANLVTDVAAPPGGVLTNEAWQALRSLGYHSAILAPEGLSSLGLSSSGTKPTGLALVNLDDDAVPVAISGAGLASTLTELLHDGQPEHWVRQVNTLAARFALHDQAVTADAVVIALPRQATAPLRSGLATITDLLDNLSEAGLLTTNPVTDIALSAAPQHAPHANFAYPAEAHAAELPARYLARIDALYTRMEVLHGALAPAIDGPQPDDILMPLRESLLDTVSAARRGHTNTNSPVLRTVSATLNWLYDGVSITRDSGSYTLASSNAPLLLTVQNTLPYEVSVQVAIVDGVQAGLTADDPGIITIGPGPRSIPVKFDSHVSRSGTFSVYAQLLAPNDAQWGSAVPLTIDSRAYGALTVVLMAVAGGVLMIMVIWRIAQRVRGRRATVPVANTDSEGSEQ